MKICPSCGYENIDEAQFCRDCGSKLDQIIEKPEDSVQSNTLAGSEQSIITKLFFKTDKYTNELRFAKAKSISVGVFVFFFLFAMVVGTASIYVDLIVGIIIGFIFAVPVYVLGYVVGLIIDKIRN